MNNLINRFLNYVKIDTRSDFKSNDIPSSKNQIKLLNILRLELEELNLEDVNITKEFVLTGLLKSNCNSNITIALIAHVDTTPECNSKNIKPNIIYNYDGSDIKVDNKLLFCVNKNEYLKKLKNDTLITTDGNTNLGADDKAGIAIIMELLSHIKSSNIKHHNIRVFFTPDEEISTGLNNFDITKYNCTYGYTIDGGEFNEVNYENFNASTAYVSINGIETHPGSAKNKMINAIRLYTEFDMLLSQVKRPESTEKYEGFYHVDSINGNASKLNVEYLIRNHNTKLFEEMKKDMLLIKDFLNKKYKNKHIKVKFIDSYYNMYDKIKENDIVLKVAINAIESLGYKPKITPIRGGTDGARLTYQGLNTINLGTGGYNCHSKKEFVSVNQMQKVIQILINIVKEG